MTTETTKPDPVVLTCRHCSRTSRMVSFRDTAFLILGSALFGSTDAETRWPIICDDCWQRFRERFPILRSAHA